MPRGRSKGFDLSHLTKEEKQERKKGQALDHYYTKCKKNPNHKKGYSKIMKDRASKLESKIATLEQQNNQLKIEIEQLQQQNPSTSFESTQIEPLDLSLQKEPLDLSLQKEPLDLSTKKQSVQLFE